MWEQDTGKLLTAIDKIIRDPDKKYDECMIEQFLKTVTNELQKLDIGTWNIQAKTILQKLQSFVEDEAFVMTNQARVYKTYLSVFRSTVMTEDSMAALEDFLQGFWSSLGTVIINHDLAAITAVLMTIIELVKSESSHSWLISREFQPRISVTTRRKNYKIQDIVSLAEFYLESSENYHTKNKAELLLKNLLRTAIERKLNRDHQHFKNLQQVTIKLINDKSVSVLHILINLFSKPVAGTTSRAMLDSFSLVQPLEKRFQESSSDSRENLSTICRLLGLITEDDNLDTVMKQLKQQGQIDAIIAFLIESPCGTRNLFLQSYLLGPLALRLESVGKPDIETLVKELETIKNCICDKTITTCLVQLGRTIDQKPEFLGGRTFALTLEVLLEYTRSFSNSTREFRNVMLCCSNLNKLLALDERISPDNIRSTQSSSNETLQKVDIHDESLKPVALALIRILSDTQRKLVSLDKDASQGEWINQIVDLASNCKDAEIKEELDSLLQEFHKDYQTKETVTNGEAQVEDDMLLEEYKADIRSSLDDILDYELFSDNILDCY